MLRKCLGSEGQHTVFEGQVMGMILVVELIRVEGYVCTVAIGADSQVAIWVTASTRGASGQHIKSECTALLNWSQGGFWTLASARALCLTTFYSCRSISGAF